MIDLEGSSITARWQILGGCSDCATVGLRTLRLIAINIDQQRIYETRRMRCPRSMRVAVWHPITIEASAQPMMTAVRCISIHSKNKRCPVPFDS